MGGKILFWKLQAHRSAPPSLTSTTSLEGSSGMFMFDHQGEEEYDDSTSINSGYPFVLLFVLCHAWNLFLLKIVANNREFYMSIASPSLISH